MVHYLYVGHFIPEDGYIRFRGCEPVVARPINMQSIHNLLPMYFEDVVEHEKIFASWSMSVLPNYIRCDLIHSPVDALRFVADYAEKEGAILLDQGAFILLSPQQIRQLADVKTGHA